MKPAPVVRLIVGMSRGGTTSLMQCLNVHPDVCAFGESQFWGRNWIDPNPDGFYSQDHLVEISKLLLSNKFIPLLSGDIAGVTGENLNDVAARAVKKLDGPVTPETVFNVLGDSIAKNCGKKVWVEKTPHHLQHIDRIIHYCRDVRIVVLIRNVSEFLLSYKHQGDRKPIEVKKRFHKLYHPAVASVVARGYLKAAFDAQVKYPENILLASLNDIKENSQENLGLVQRHFLLSDFPLSNYYRKTNTSFPEGERPLLSPEELIWLKLIAGNSALKLGQNIPEPPLVIFPFIKSVFYLFPWLFSNIKFISRIDNHGIRGMVERWLR